MRDPVIEARVRIMSEIAMVDTSRSPSPILIFACNGQNQIKRSHMVLLNDIPIFARASANRAAIETLNPRDDRQTVRIIHRLGHKHRRIDVRMNMLSKHTFP
jgi:hypothetical protein